VLRESVYLTTVPDPCINQCESLEERRKKMKGKKEGRRKK
jgi:hypothetical protein